MRALVFVVFASVSGCTTRAECRDVIVPVVTSDLEHATVGRCEHIGHCITFGYQSETKFRFRLPEGPGTFTLEDIDAETCESDEDDGGETCTPAAGSIVVHEVHPPEQGKPIGRLDANLSFTSGPRTGITGRSTTGSTPQSSATTSCGRSRPVPRRPGVNASVQPDEAGPWPSSGSRATSSRRSPLG